MLIFKDTSMTLETHWEFKMALLDSEKAWVQRFLESLGRRTELNLFAKFPTSYIQNNNNNSTVKEN